MRMNLIKILKKIGYYVPKLSIDDLTYAYLKLEFIHF